MTSISPGPDALTPTQRTTLHRFRERGHYDRALINSILDEAILCHVGFAADQGALVTPVAFTRIDDALYLHGASGNRTLRAVAAGAEVCVTVTLVDGLVLARSAFHHSVRFRSVMLFGRAVRVDDDGEKLRASLSLLDHLVPGRSADARPPSPTELRATLMVRVPIDEASAKVRGGGPTEEPEDLTLPVWSGVIPLATVAEPAVPAEDLVAGTPQPSYVEHYPDRRRPPD